MVITREAKLSDAKILSVFAESCFRDAFTDQNNTEDINAYCTSTFREEALKYEISSADFATLIAEKDSQLVAYAQLYFGKPPDCIQSNKVGEIRRFYVDSHWHGKGVAQNLMSDCFQVLEEHNVDVAWLGVWEENLKAIAFYKKFNFNEVGGQMFLLGNDQQRDVLMARQLK